MGVGGAKFRKDGRHAEVEQHGSSIGSDEDVFRLEIGVDHQVPMGVLYGLADTEKKLNTASERKPMGNSVLPCTARSARATAIKGANLKP